MRKSTFAFLACAALWLVACDGKKSTGAPSEPEESTPSANPSASTSSLERPGDLPRPPTQGLPADLRPPTKLGK